MRSHVIESTVPIVTTAVITRYQLDTATYLPNSTVSYLTCLRISIERDGLYRNAHRY